MRLRLARLADLTEMAALDTDPGGWRPEDMIDYVMNLGTIKLVAEGRWVLGWAAFRKSQRLLVVERLAVRDDAQTEVETAGRLLHHVERLTWRCGAVDLTVPDGRLALLKATAGRGYSATLVRDYYGPQEDAVAFHLSLT